MSLIPRESKREESTLNRKKRTKMKDKINDDKIKEEVIRTINCCKKKPQVQMELNMNILKRLPKGYINSITDI